MDQTLKYFGINMIVGRYLMDYDYTVEIEYLATKTLEIKALSEEWAKIVAQEEWAAEHKEAVKSIEVLKGR